MSDTRKGVFLLIPAYSEGARIGSVIQGVKERYPSLEIVVIDDGSRDDTCSQAIEAGARVISHPFNLGYGVALQTGYKYALKKGYEGIVQMDGDGQHDPTYIQLLLDTIQKGDTDLVIGSRFLKTEGSDREGLPYQAPLIRRCGMWLFGAIASLIIKQKVTDPTSGYQAMNRRVLEWVSSDKFPWDYPDADLIIMLHRAGFRIQEVPVRMYENREKKSMHSGWKPIYYVFKMFLSILVTLMRQ
ncbi:MAG TPA: glycosyltransferase family 2 protein [Thermodesulfobacteriota bacterium]|nr:glycosyltransferase family 2 protein [Thermodesulfobacteriota bacterium]